MPTDPVVEAKTLASLLKPNQLIGGLSGFNGASSVFVLLPSWTPRMLSGGRFALPTRANKTIPMGGMYVNGLLH